MDQPNPPSQAHPEKEGGLLDSLWSRGEKMTHPATVAHEVRATFKNERITARAAEILSKEYSGVAVDGNGIHFLATYPYSRPGSRRQTARRAHELLHEGHAPPEEMTVHGRLEPDKRVWFELYFRGAGLPTAEEGRLLRQTPLQLLHPNSPPEPLGTDRLGWKPRPALLPAQWNLKISLMLASWLSALTAPNFTSWPGSAVLWMCIIGATIVAFRDAIGVDEYRTGARSVVMHGAIAGLPIAMGRIQRATTVGPVDALQLAGAVIFTLIYLVSCWILYAAWRKYRHTWRSLGLIAISGATAAGLTRDLIDAPRRKFLEGLGYPESATSLSLFEALSVVTAQTWVLAGVVFAGCFLAAWWARESLPPIPALAMTLLLCSPTGFAVLNIGNQISAIGSALAAGRLGNAGYAASCVMVATTDKPLTTPSWSAPRILVGPPTGPALLIDTSRPTVHRVGTLQAGKIVEIVKPVAITPVAPEACAQP